jgi:hypothetical protein
LKNSKLSSLWLRNIQLFADKLAQVGINICMTWNYGTVAVKMINVLVMPCAMLYKAAPVNI